MGAIPANIHWSAQTLTAGVYCWLAARSGTTGRLSLTYVATGAGRRTGQRLRGTNAAYSTLRDIPGVKALRDATRGGVTR